MSTAAGAAAEFSVIETAVQNTAVIRVTVPMAEIPQAHMSARPRIAAAIPTLGAGAAGPGCTRWTPPAEGRIYMEIGNIVDLSFAAQGDIEAGTLPAGRAAHFTLVGGFERLGAAWGRLFAWCAEQGLQPAGDNWEIYGETPADPAQQRTDLYALLA